MKNNLIRIILRKLMKSHLNKSVFKAKFIKAGIKGVDFQQRRKSCLSIRQKEDLETKDLMR